ncbi:heme-degrading domain-containing protein [Falsihalocynthiibacter sp. S25ZX9]|uniref:heme-degrading domain-containing protein n=1 Tax=Falsihalocynthiibacter sp. S25ZX9 TaxID=3240870 RepID=UPI0035100B5E
MTIEDEKALLETLAAQEAQLVFPKFSTDMALTLGARLMAHGQEHDLPISVNISRNGQCLFACALTGARRDNEVWIQRKNCVVNRFGHSSFYMGTHLRALGTTMEAKYLLQESHYAAHGGAFPILIKETGPIGTVTVSGLSQRDDHDLVVKFLGELLAET